jgi:hypothetical protein
MMLLRGDQTLQQDDTLATAHPLLKQAIPWSASLCGFPDVFEVAVPSRSCFAVKSNYRQTIPLGDLRE